MSGRFFLDTNIFAYTFDAKANMFAHASGIILLTPGGRISRYFYGVEFPGRDLRLGLVDASAGKIGSPIDYVLLYCYHYDPTTGKYGLVVANVLRAAALVTFLVLGGFLLVMFKRENYVGTSGARHARPGPNAVRPHR